MPDQNKDHVYKAIVKLNNMRFKGINCDACEDSVYYQLAAVEGIDGPSTPSDWQMVKEQVEQSTGVEITLSCCGCGEHHEMTYILDPENADKEEYEDD